MDENETINDIAAWLCGIADKMEASAKEFDRERMERDTCRAHPHCNRHADLMRQAADMRNLADRIKAAHTREVSKATEEAASKAILNRDAKDAAEYAAQALNAQPDARGNIAAIRAAIEEIQELAAAMSSEEDKPNAFAILDVCSAALAAPPRNCDKGFRDIEEYRLAFKRECQSHEDCADCPISKTDAFKNGVLCFFTWLLSADEGGAE